MSEKPQIKRGKYLGYSVTIVMIVVIVGVIIVEISSSLFKKPLNTIQLSTELTASKLAEETKNINDNFNILRTSLTDLKNHVEENPTITSIKDKIKGIEGNVKDIESNVKEIEGKFNDASIDTLKQITDLKESVSVLKNNVCIGDVCLTKSHLQKLLSDSLISVKHRRPLWGTGSLLGTTQIAVSSDTEQVINLENNCIYNIYNTIPVSNRGKRLYRIYAVWSDNFTSGEGISFIVRNPFSQDVFKMNSTTSGNSGFPCSRDGYSNMIIPSSSSISTSSLDVIIPKRSTQDGILAQLSLYYIELQTIDDYSE